MRSNGICSLPGIVCYKGASPSFSLSLVFIELSSLREVRHGIDLRGLLTWFDMTHLWQNGWSLLFWNLSFAHHRLWRARRVWRDLVGAAITLSTEQSKRNLRYVLADHIILTFHPVISSSTRPLRHLKENIIHHCTSLGRPVFPSTSPTTIAAQKRPLDFNTFDRLLNRCDITYDTLTSYGMN